MRIKNKKQLGISRTQKGGNNMSPVNPKPRNARPAPEEKMDENNFEKELRDLINKYCEENKSNTPDFILAIYLSECLKAFNNATKNRDKWYSVKLCPGCSEFEKEK